ncbi:MAG TPA: type II toxin-antitoxin system VapC family toxin [Candidatus Binatia bacterium]
MVLLLDTHVLIWWLADDRRLSKDARNLIADAHHRVLVSAASVWEIAIKSALKRIEIELDDLEDAILKSGFEPLPIALLHAVRVGRLPDVHRDPFDRMLVAQAGVEELRLVTHDRVFERYGLTAEGLPPIFV